MVLSCQEDTVNVPEKSILHLLRAGSTRQRKSAAHFQPEQTLLWYELHYHKTGRNAFDFYRIICIRDESVPDSETNTLRSFVSVPLLA